MLSISSIIPRHIFITSSYLGVFRSGGCGAEWPPKFGLAPLYAKLLVVALWYLATLSIIQRPSLFLIGVFPPDVKGAE